MNAFSSSLNTILFSLLFTMLLVLTAGAEDVDRTGFLTPENEITPDEPSSSNNFWPPVHLRGLRSSNGKPTFIRFGKRGSPSFIRFGRK